eukprot:1724423-Pyramimonas_sp.AAC.1
MPSSPLAGSASGRTVKLHSQRYQAEGAAPAGGGPPTQGTWPRSVAPPGKLMRRITRAGNILLSSMGGW